MPLLFLFEFFILFFPFQHIIKSHWVPQKKKKNTLSQYFALIIFYFFLHLFLYWVNINLKFHFCFYSIELQAIFFTQLDHFGLKSFASILSFPFPSFPMWYNWNGFLFVPLNHVGPAWLQFYKVFFFFIFLPLATYTLTVFSLSLWLPSLIRPKWTVNSSIPFCRFALLSSC